MVIIVIIFQYYFRKISISKIELFLIKCRKESENGIICSDLKSDVGFVNQGSNTDNK